jgi:eukaryotic-like serine/threonine-protein kinase
VQRFAYAPGDVLAGRYEVVRLLGRGGMGEVYEVDDHELRVRVALKTIRTDRPSPLMVVRFRRELYLARQVTHPNVCRVYDLGHHRGQLFLTMELLVGETLARRLARDKQLSPAEVLPLVRQIASAIDAAHAAGVVHRDLKPGNVVLVGSRAIVTDFGIAHAVGDPFHQLSQVCRMIGSPDYMAPEQVAGDPVTPAADVFALGAVIYEMVTGVRPFRGAHGRELVPPCQHVPELDPRWSAAIMRCLAPVAAQRFACAADAVQALEVARKPRGIKLAATCAALVVAGAVAWRVADARAEAPVEGRRSIAIVGFKNLSLRPDTAWLSSAVAESLTVDLAAGEQLRTISGEDVAHARSDLALPDADDYSPDTLQHLRDVTGADFVVVGSYLAFGADKHERLQLSVRVQDTRTGATVVRISDSATIGEVLELVHRDGERLRAGMGIESAAPIDGRAALAALPAGSEALRRFCAGLAKLRELDAQAARVLFEEAAALEPTNAMIHAQLAEALLALGYERDAKAAIRRAAAFASTLPAAARTLIAARTYEITKDWDHAIAAYRALADEHPDELEYRLRLAKMLTRANRGTEALSTIAELRLRPSGASSDPRVDLTEAQAAQATGDFLHAERAAARAVSRAEATGARRLLAHGHLELARALSFQGKPDEAIAHAREAKQQFAVTGDKGHEANALGVEAYALNERGDVDEAERLDVQVLAMRRELGDRKRAGTMLLNIALIVSNRGQLDRARRLTLEALDNARAIGDRGTEALAQIRLAGIAAAAGDPVGAVARVDEAMAARSPDDLRNYYFGLETRGAAEMMMGRLDDSRAHLEQAIAVARRLGARADATGDLVFVANIRIDAGDLAAAHRALEAAGTDARPEGVAWRLTVDARLALAEGHTEQAARGARDAFDRLVRLGHTVAALDPATTLVRASIARGDLAAARDIVDRLAAMKLEGALSCLTVALLRAEVTGDRAAFAQIRDDARAAKLALVERDAGLGLRRN